MHTQFKYYRALKFAELSYYMYGQKIFVEYFNGFLEEYELVINDDKDKNFENCINYLNNISIIMVEKFLCAYLFYCERGLKPIMDGFSVYETKRLKLFDEPSVTLRAVMKHRDLIGRKEPSFEKALAIKLNKDGVFYTNKSKGWSLFNCGNKKPEEDSRYFVNVKDIGLYLNKVKEDLTPEERKEIKSFYKTIIGKPIEKSFELP